MADNKPPFPKGIIAFNPHEKAPDFVVASIIITPKELGEWLKGEGAQYYKDTEKYGKQVKLTMKKAKDGKLYLEVDIYEPKQNSSSNLSQDDLAF